MDNIRSIHAHHRQGKMNCIDYLSLFQAVHFRVFDHPDYHKYIADIDKVASKSMSD